MTTVAAASKASAPLDPGTMTVVDCVCYQERPYRAKDFDSQRSYRISLQLNGSRRRSEHRAIVEVGVYLHWRDQKPVDVAVDLSCMSGCTERCVFCAAADLTAVSLTEQQILAQAVKALQEVGAHERAFFESFDHRPKVTFSFEGMGEPSRNPRLIVRAIDLLRHAFRAQYHLQFIISTTAANPDALKTWSDADLGLQSLQISLHAVDQDKRYDLLRQDVEADRILRAVDEFHEASPKTEIKINYLLLRGCNDTEEDAAALQAFLRDKPYYLKISRLNETEPAMRASLRRPSDEALRAFADKVAPGRPKKKTYVYGSAEEIQMSCGQLASYAHVHLDDTKRHTVREIYNRILDGQTILFLGAGASRTLPGADELARRLYDRLDFETPFAETGFSLRDVVDLFVVKNHLRDVDEMLEATMESAPYPAEFLWLTLFPWRAIYTTNYDRFVERAYDDARKRSLTEYRCMPIRKTEELSRSFEQDTIRLVKLHGCISQGAGEIVLSGSDYIADYHEKRDFLFKMLESDALRHDVVFAGYSFRDEYVGSRIAALKRAAGALGTASYAVLLPSEFTEQKAAVLERNFAVKMIPTSFTEFLRELVTLARRPVVYVAGSKKQRVVGARTARKDFGEKIDELSAILGAELTEEGVRVVTGATATDKVGYLVAKHMDRALVTTYRWHGATEISDRRIGDEPEKMISVRDIGFKPSDVIEKMARIAQVAIFIGGGPLALQEFFRLYGHGRFVIPVALGDGAYASDVIHSFLRQNARTIDRFNSDRGLAIKEPHKPHRPALTPEQLDELDLASRSPRSVADTILEVLRDHRLTMPEADLAAIAGL